MEFSMKHFQTCNSDFHMLVTRLSGKAEKMTVSEEICEYFSDLIKPLRNVSGAGVADMQAFELMELK